MRKKSHISLAKYIINSTSDQDLKKHKLSFYVGSILPDVKPSFVFKRHEINGTFPDVKQRIDKLINGKKNKPAKNKRRYYMNLGQVTHYVADYFTYPHNSIYAGNIKDHCAYEEDLKIRLRQYLKNGDAMKNEERAETFSNQDAIYDFIQKRHQNYLGRKINVEEDIKHIVEVNHQIVEGILQLFQQTKQKYQYSNS